MVAAVGYNKQCTFHIFSIVYKHLIILSLKINITINGQSISSLHNRSIYI